MSRPVLGLLPLLLVFAAPVHAASIHKWVDAQGQVHFGDEAAAQEGSSTVTPKGGSFVKTEHPATAADTQDAAPPAIRKAGEPTRSQHDIDEDTVHRGQ